MELPVKKETTNYTTLEEIRARKELLLSELQKDNTRFSTLWSQTFLKREDSSKAEYISNLVGKGITAIDTFLLVRKLIKNYGGLFGLSKKSSTKKKR